MLDSEIHVSPRLVTAILLGSILVTQPVVPRPAMMMAAVAQSWWPVRSDKQQKGVVVD